MSAYCIYEYSIDTQLSGRSEEWIAEIPYSIDKVLTVAKNKIICLNNINENKSTLIKIAMLRPFDDFVYIDSDLNNDFNSFSYLGVYTDENNVDFYVYAKIMGKKDLEV